MAALGSIAPVLGLFVLAPLVAEYLLGNIAIDALPLGLYFMTLYGGGAVLIRETARRTGRGWPAIGLLALAYGLIEEGLVTQSLFAPTYFGYALIAQAFIPWLGVGGWWTLYVLTLHAVWSICVPIALIEAFVPERAHSPWLGRAGLTVTLALFLAGAGLNAYTTYQQERFLASPRQFAGLALVLALVVSAAVARRTPREPSRRPAPSPRIVGLCSLLISSAFTIANWVVDGWIVVGTYLVLYALSIGMVGRWSRRAGWNGRHVLALAGGALLTYAWQGYPHEPILGSRGMVDTVGNTIFALGAGVLLAFAVRTQQRAAASTDTLA